MADENGKPRGWAANWGLSIGTVAIALIGYGELRSRVDTTADSVNRNWAQDIAFRDSSNVSERVFRETVIRNLAELNTKIDMLQRKP